MHDPDEMTRNNKSMYDLSILLLSHNRRRDISMQAKSLERLLKDIDSNITIQVVISETAKEGMTASPLITEISGTLGWNYLFSTPGYLTAEQHLEDRISLAQGEYVWILGDDDPILVEGFERLISEIREKSYDIMVFNSFGGSSNLSSLNLSSRSRITRDFSYTCFAELLMNFGFWYVPSGFSTLVIRNKLIDRSLIAKLNAVTPIYSHVTMLAITGHNKKILVAADPLVIYKTNPSDEGKSDGNWQRYSKRQKSSHSFPWVASFCSHLAMMNQAGVINLNRIPEIVDQNHSDVFVWHLLPLQIMLTQIKSDLSQYDDHPTLYSDLKLIDNLSIIDFKDAWKQILGYDGYVQEKLHTALGIYFNLFTDGRFARSSNPFSWHKRRKTLDAKEKIMKDISVLEEHAARYMFDPLSFNYIYYGKPPEARLYLNFSNWEEKQRLKSQRFNFQGSDDELGSERLRKSLHKDLAVFVWLNSLVIALVPRSLRQFAWAAVNSLLKMKSTV